MNSLLELPNRIGIKMTSSEIESLGVTLAQIMINEKQMTLCNKAKEEMEYWGRLYGLSQIRLMDSCRQIYDRACITDTRLVMYGFPTPDLMTGMIWFIRVIGDEKITADLQGVQGKC